MWRVPAWGDRALSLLLPARCIGCGASDTYLCDPCLLGMTRLKRPLCPGCALPGWDDLCPVCQRRPLELSGIAVNLVLEGVARKAVH